MKYGFFAQFILYFFLCSIRSQASCLPPINLEKFIHHLEHTKKTFFPMLASVEISVSYFRSEAYFLQTKPAVLSLLEQQRKRKYFVDLNLKLLECPPSDGALEAILVHELEHIVDYESWSILKLTQHAMMYATSLQYRAIYERQTDKKVLEKHLYNGLADYRIWLFQWLSKRDLELKKYLYLTPEEIAAIYNKSMI